MRKIYLDIQEFMVLFIVENFVAKYLPDQCTFLAN